MRVGSEYFTEPAEPVQRRYEALRHYFVEEASAEAVGARFGYSPATVHQLAAELRAGDASVTEIAQALAAEGSPVSAQTVWAILKAEGMERLGRRGPGGPAPRLEPVRAGAIDGWPAGARYDCDHAGLYLLLPAMATLGLDALVSAARYPGTKMLSSFHSLA